jgi:HSP20 family protein
MSTEIQTRRSRSDPWSDLDRAMDELRQHVFDAFGVFPFAPANPPSTEDSAGRFLRPARADVIDTGKSYRIVAEIPGIRKEDLEIRVRGTSVEIRGETAKESRKEDESLIHRERSYAGYYRSLDLPEAVVGKDAKAKVENGVLELELPKQTPTPSETEVKVPVQ